VLNLLPAIARQGRHQYTVLLSDLSEYGRVAAPNLKVITLPSNTRTNLILRDWWLNKTVHDICREERADALLCLGNLAPHTPHVPTVLFLQNAFYVYNDRFVSKGLSLRNKLIRAYARFQFRHLAKNVTVIVETEVMKQRLTSLFPVPASNVVVVPDCGPSLSMDCGSSNGAKRDASETFTFLCVAVYYPHKNLEVLVEAVKILRTLTTRPFRCLITVDPKQNTFSGKFLARIKHENLERSLVNIGYVPHERLPEVYASADAFILPTLLESFGRPYGEAMQYELPILTSDLDFAHERCQDAAIYFDPMDAGSVARAMAAMMEDGNLRSKLVENGRRLLHQMPTWDDVAAQFVEVLERAAKGAITTPSSLVGAAR
jgi:glycosyltransferase involved in cell wall biosynthesis